MVRQRHADPKENHESVTSGSLRVEMGRIFAGKEGEGQRTKWTNSTLNIGRSCLPHRLESNTPVQVDEPRKTSSPETSKSNRTKSKPKWNYRIKRAAGGGHTIKRSISLGFAGKCQSHRWSVHAFFDLMTINYSRTVDWAAQLVRFTCFSCFRFSVSFCLWSCSSPVSLSLSPLNFGHCRHVQHLLNVFVSSFLPLSFAVSDFDVNKASMLWKMIESSGKAFAKQLQVEFYG